MIEPGQPCVMTSGSASACGERMCRKWMPEPVDHRSELGERVEPRLGGAPVVFLAPIPAELTQIGERDALRPVLDRLGLWPAGAV